MPVEPVRSGSVCAITVALHAKALHLKLYFYNFI